ncbi:MAG: hypothetical protein GY755_10665 [Chloroflexi bacterium]|nr:hypothetical protein [Chloroflexota bacterium]
MKKILLAISLVALVAISCGVSSTVTSMQPLKRSTVTAPLSPTAQITPSPPPTQANIYTVTGNWNLREGRSENGPFLGVVFSGRAIEVAPHDRGWTWALVHTGGDTVSPRMKKKESYQ